MAYTASFKSLELKHTAHILYDLFYDRRKGNWANYDYDTSLIEEMRSPEFSVEMWGLHSTLSEKKEIEEGFVHYWNIGVDNTFYGPDWCDVFLWLNYSPNISSNINELVRTLTDFMKENGLIVIVNSPIPELDFLNRKGLKSRDDIISDIKSYTLFANENVLVWEK